MLSQYLFSKIKNLFPEDTRCAELLSSITLIFSTILIFTGSIVVTVSMTWLIIACIAGLVQFISLVFFEHCEKIRVASALLVGAIMFHLGIINFQNSVFSFSFFLVTGIANIYAFLLNNQRVVWK